MKKMFLLFSHNLSQNQINDAINDFNIEEFVSLPKNLQDLWSDVPTQLENLKDYLLPIKKFLVENSDFKDVVLIQGDFGAVYHIVNFVKDLNLLAIYATTSREVEEFQENGKNIKKSIFEHRRFRKYE